MNRRDYFLNPIRIALLSAIGLVQVMLVMFGCVYICDQFQDAYPFVRHLRGISAAIGFLTLIYPSYILMAIVPPTHPKRSKFEGVDCPVCGTKTSSPRLPTSWRQCMHGGWTCRKCGCEMDSQGTKIE